MKRFFIESFGCQMNKYDSELVTGILKNSGYTAVDDIEDANIVLINTCSVREHAEKRVMDKIDSYYSAKKKSDRSIIGVLGCMAERMGNRIIEKIPAVNFVLGPDEYRNLPETLALHLGLGDYKISEVNKDEETYSDLYPSRCGGVSAWIAIMRGCNNFCSYCIVPYVRGRERSRPMQDIINEAKLVVAEGFSEIVLLGQNVNSYRHEDIDFPALINAVSKVPGIKRVRFATSHPKDVSLELLEAIACQDNICNHIHLAVQSGSNSILKAMNRKYTREDFIHLIEDARKIIGDPGIFTDVIVGFPGESEADFKDTYDLVKRLRFDGLFSFKYSPRQGTAAFKLKETVSEDEKVERLIRLNQLQKEIILERNSKLIGSCQKILVEGPDKKRKPGHYMGRSDTNKITVFRHENRVSVGEVIDVKITNAEGLTLFGELIKR